VIFRDREDAGRQLAAALKRFAGSDPIVLALPRGGVRVAFEVARELAAPLDVVLVRKIGAPWQRELAAAAVVDGERTDIVVNQDVVESLGISAAYLEAEVKRQVEEIERRRKAYFAGGDRAHVAGRTAIVVDDGIATGATVRAALRAIRRRAPRRLVLAVPVAPQETLDALRSEVDEIVCLATPPYFGAIGAFYGDFSQIDDDEVRALLARAKPQSEKPPSGERGAPE